MFARRQEELALLAAAEKKLRLAEEVLWLRNFFIFNVGLFRVPLKHVAGKKEQHSFLNVYVVVILQKCIKSHNFDRILKQVNQIHQSLRKMQRHSKNAEK